MFEAVNKPDILRTLRRLVTVNDIPPQGRLVIGVLFTRPSLPLAKMDIIPNLEYLHRRTEQHMHFFCPGFAFGSENYARNYWSSQDYRSALDINERIESDRNIFMFSEKKFVECVSQFEDDTDWKYSGETDLLLFQAFVSNKRTEIDYESAISCTIEQLQKANVFQSLNTFLEKLIMESKPIHNYSNNTSLSRMSDKEGWRYGSRALAEWLVSLLPGNDLAIRLFSTLKELRIKDISKK